MLRHHWSNDRMGVNIPSILIPKNSLPEQMEEKWEWKPVNPGSPGKRHGGDGGGGDVMSSSSFLFRQLNPETSQPLCLLVNAAIHIVPSLYKIYLLLLVGMI